MKKILIALLPITAILAFLAFNSNNSVNNFFSKDEGVVYKEDGLLWTTKISDKGLFSSTYITDFSVGKTSFSLNHVSFFSPFGAKVKSTLTLPSSFVGNESTKLLSSSSLDDIMPAIKASLMEYAVIHAKNGLKEFFTPGDSFLDNIGGSYWHLDSSDVRENSATYKTTSFILDKTIMHDGPAYEIPMTHEATFTGENLSLFNIGNLKSTITLPERELPEIFLGQQLSFDYTITFDGLDTKVVVPEQNTSKNYYNQTNVFIDESIVMFSSNFRKDMFSFDSITPLTSSSMSDNISDINLKMKGFKMSSQNIFNKDFDLWFTDSIFNIEKAVGYDDKTGNQVLTLDNFLIKGLTKPGYKNETITFDLKISSDNLYISNSPIKLENMNIDITLDEIDAQSIQKIAKTTRHFNPYDQYQLMEAGATFIAEVARVLEKKLKIFFNDISVKYNDEVHSIKGVVEYVGNGKPVNLFSTTWADQLYAKFDVKIGEKLFTSIIKKNAAEQKAWPSYYYSNFATEAEIEAHLLEKLKEMNVIPANGFVAFVAEFKNGEMLINGKLLP